MSFREVLENRLSLLDIHASRRALLERRGVDFSSNDYLGFSQDSELKFRISERFQEIPIGSSASRLLRGHLPTFEKAETTFAQFCGQEAALFFATGYQANVGLLSALLRPDDLVFSDQFNHASLIDGIRLSGSKKFVYPHSNLKSLRELLKQTANLKQLKVIVTESIFGMDGDIAPLEELVELAEEFSAALVVDEAHATGLWGNFERNQGAGLVQKMGLSQRVLATIHPGGKSFGVGGAWVAGSSALKEYLINFSRPVIFSTAPMPLLATALQTAVEYWGEVGRSRAEVVLKRSHQLRESLKSVLQAGEKIPECAGAITPVLLGENRKALEKARQLQKLGLDIRAIRPPTVPENTARLRITTQWNQTEADLNQLIEGFRGH